MPYDIEFSRQAFEGIGNAPQKNASQIARAITERLTADPIGLGKPLQGKYKGYRRLRVGDWRVIYMVEDGRVVIHDIVLRRDAYQA